MRNCGRLTRKQIKGILTSIGRSQSIAGIKGNQNFVSDNDINAIMRRMDADGDEELSFSDFFSSLLPYFIYGDLKNNPTVNQMAGQAIKKRERTIEGAVQKAVHGVRVRQEADSFHEKEREIFLVEGKLPHP